jgi:uncharacterized low-complexity protein
MGRKTNKTITAALAFIIAATATATAASASVTNESEREFAHKQSIHQASETMNAGGDSGANKTVDFEVISGLGTGETGGDSQARYRTDTIDAWEIFLQLGSIKDKNVSS